MHGTKNLSVDYCVLDSTVGDQTSESVKAEPISKRNENESKVADSRSSGLEMGSDQEDDSDDAIFNELFPELMEMRSKAAGMGFEERRKMAEKVGILFK